MKKILSILFLAAITLNVSAQRYGTTVGRDNTGRVLTWGDITKADTTGATVDTVLTSLSTTANGNVYNTNVYFTLADSCVFALSSVTYCQKGDRLTVIITNSIASSASFVNFLGYSGLATKWKLASTGTKITLAASKKATISFIFDGTYWDETSRSVQ